MTAIDLKGLVAQAVGKEWETFAAAHPNLARVLDETLLVEEVTTQLWQDPEYQKSLANAELVGQTAERVTELVKRLMGKWLS
jgi:hypothetical protein